jgi:hypothetical protein
METMIVTTRVQADQIDVFEQMLEASGWQAVQGIENDEGELEGVIWEHANTEDAIFLVVVPPPVTEEIEYIETTGRVIQ